MTHGDFLELMQVLLGRGVTGVSADPGTLSVILNTSYQFNFEYCYAKFPWFYARSDAYSGNIDTTALDPPFRKLAQLEDSASLSGTVRIANNSEYQYVKNIPQLAAVASNPICRVDDGQIVVDPNTSSGTIYYYQRIPTVDLISPSTNITTIGSGDALLHPDFEGAIIAKALVHAYARHAQSPEINDQERQAYVKVILEQQAYLDKEFAPLGRWDRVIPESAGV